MSATIQTLIINSPFHVPTCYHQYDRDNRTFNTIDGRRPAGFLIATAGSKGFDDPGVFCEIPLVNESNKGIPISLSQPNKESSLKFKKLAQFIQNKFVN